MICFWFTYYLHIMYKYYLQIVDTFCDTDMLISYRISYVRYITFSDMVPTSTRYLSTPFKVERERGFSLVHFY